MKVPCLAAALAACLPCALTAQTPAPGLRIYGALNAMTTQLLDNTGAVVHTWNSAFRPGAASYVLPDGTMLRAINAGGGQITLPGVGGGVQRVALDGTVLWDYRHSAATFISHHDIRPMPNGNVLLIVWDQKTAAAAAAAGRDPALLRSTFFYPDAIVEVQPTGATSGTVVWEWHLWDHLIQDWNSGAANYGVVANHPELMDINYPRVSLTNGDWNHANGLDYDPFHDWVLLSVREQGEILILDHGTTTAQAAGHSGGRWGKGGDILYRWGNPEAYRAGTVADVMLAGAHCPRFVPAGYPGAGHVTIFNNFYSYAPNTSAVLEIQLPVDAAGNFVFGPNGRYGPMAPVWTYTAPGFFSAILSSAQRLPNGNTLVCSGSSGTLFEVDTSNTVVWQVAAGAQVFQCNYVDRFLWADRTALSVASGGNIAFDLIAGTAQAARPYLVLGSLAGTTPGIGLGSVHLPLNFDPLLELMAGSPNSPAFRQTLGLLGSTGRATAAFQAAPGLIPPELAGRELNFAFFTVDPATLTVALASNAVKVTLGQ